MSKKKEQTDMQTPDKKEKTTAVSESSISNVPQIVVDKADSDVISMHSYDAENFTDPSFENELSHFKSHLIQTPIFKRRRMRPNVSVRWIKSLQNSLDAH